MGQGPRMSVSRAFNAFAAKVAKVAKWAGHPLAFAIGVMQDWPILAASPLRTWKTAS